MKIAFVGCGNMSQILIKGLLISKVKNNDITVSNRTQEKLINFQHETGINIAFSNIECVKNQDIVFLGVKPKDLEEVLYEIKDYLNPKTIIVSMIASKSIKMISSIIKNPIVRIMPNTASLIQRGVIAICSNNEESENIIFSLLSDLGLIIKIEEKLFSGFIGISGSAIAYVYMFIEALTKAGVNEGFKYETALKIVNNTVLGGSLMVLNSDKTPNDLKNDVCSPNGTTIEAVLSLEKNKFNEIVNEAVSSASKKDQELMSFKK